MKPHIGSKVNLLSSTPGLPIAMQRFLSTEKSVRLLKMGRTWAGSTTTIATLVRMAGEERKPRLQRRKSWDSMKVLSASAAVANKYSVWSCQRKTFLKEISSSVRK